MNKFYPKEVTDRGYSISMLHFLAYLFPNKKFSIDEYRMYDAMFMKGWGEGYLAGEIDASRRN